MATEIADVKQDAEVTDASTVDTSSATTTDAAETQTQDQTSPVQSDTAVAGEQQARAESEAEAKPEATEEAKLTNKSRTQKRIQELLEAKKKAEQALALKDEEVKRLTTLPSAAQPQPQPQQAQLPAEQTSRYWAQLYHQSRETATPEQLQDYANRYHSLAQQEQMRDLDSRVEAKLTETVRKAQYQSLVQSQFEEANRLTPFYKNGPGGPEYIKDSPVLTRALAKAQQVGAVIQSQEQLLHWITRAQVDLLAEAAAMQSGSNAQVEHKAAEIMGRTALQGASTGRSSGSTKSLEGLSSDDIEQLAIRQMRGR